MFMELASTTKAFAEPVLGYTLHKMTFGVHGLHKIQQTVSDESFSAKSEVRLDRMGSAHELGDNQVGSSTQCEACS